MDRVTIEQVQRKPAPLNILKSTDPIEWAIEALSLKPTEYLAITGVNRKVIALINAYDVLKYLAKQNRVSDTIDSLLTLDPEDESYLVESWEMGDFVFGVKATNQANEVLQEWNAPCSNMLSGSARFYTCTMRYYQVLDWPFIYSPRANFMRLYSPKAIAKCEYCV
jgi:hypothetical protein